MAVLKIVKGKVPGQILEIRGERTIFGRHPNCQIVLDNAAVSRHHAQILQSHGNYYLEDLSSRNGTQLNDLLIEGRTELHEGDEINVCDLVFQFHTRPPTSDSRPVSKSQQPSQDFSSKNSWVRAETDLSGSRRFSIQENPNESNLEGSSIVTTLNVEADDSSSGVRFAVKPSVKLRAILDISEALGSVLELDTILDRILGTLFRIYPHCDEGFILLRDAGQDELSVRAVRTRTENETGRLPISMTIVREAMNTRQAILSANAPEDKRFKSSDSLSGLQIHSVMCVPLVSRETGQALGVIQIATRSLSARFVQEDLDLLVSVATQGTLAIENVQMHLAALKQRDLERDLEYANQIQLGFLPNDRPRIDGYEFGNYYEAAKSVGGDYFDYVALPDGRIAITLGDVAGKGVPAALLMARLYSLMSTQLIATQDAAKAMDGVNKELSQSGLGFRFITCVIAILDPNTHELQVANAGHMPPMIRRASGEFEELSRSTSGLPLGIDPECAYEAICVSLSPGDLFVVYTDGVTEAMNAQSALYGRDRFAARIMNGPEDVNELLETLIEDVDRFSEGHPQSDDTCIVAVQRNR